MRAWIETKQFKELQNGNYVARRVRAWIETAQSSPSNVNNKVARRVRAWIETINVIILRVSILSHAVCVRGLKRFR